MSRSLFGFQPLEMSPGAAVVFNPVALGEGADEVTGDGAGAAGHRVVDCGAGQFRRIVGKNLLPGKTAWILSVHIHISGVSHALRRGPCDSTSLIVKDIILFLYENRKIDFVYFN